MNAPFKMHGHTQPGPFNRIEVEERSPLYQRKRRVTAEYDPQTEQVTKTRYRKSGEVKSVKTYDRGGGYFEPATSVEKYRKSGELKKTREGDEVTKYKKSGKTVTFDRKERRRKIGKTLKNIGIFGAAGLGIYAGSKALLTSKAAKSFGKGTYDIMSTIVPPGSLREGAIYGAGKVAFTTLGIMAGRELTRQGILSGLRGIKNLRQTGSLRPHKKEDWFKNIPYK